MADFRGLGLGLGEDGEGGLVGGHADGEGGFEHGGGAGKGPDRGLELGHGLGAEETLGLGSHPAGGGLSLLAPGAVGGDAGAGVHLAVELGEHDEGDAGLEVGHAGGTLPDRAPVVELVPDLLGAVGDFGRGHGGVGGEHLGADGGGDEPVTGDGDVAGGGGDDLGGLGLLFFPTAEVDGAGERGHHDELGEGDACFEGHVDGGVEGSRAVGGEAEDEGAEDVDAVLFERLELLGEGFAGVVEVFEDGLEAFGGDGFDADEGTLDVGLAHGVEVLAVFAGFHGDLGEEDHVLGELGELGHEGEALVADGHELGDLGVISLLAGEAEVGEGDGIEVVVGEGDEAEADAAELDDLVDDGLEATLAGGLTVGAPDAAEGAVLGASANGLDGGPHVLFGGHEVPAAGEELAAADAAAVVDVLERAIGEDVGDGLAPGDVSVALDDGVCCAELEGLFGEEGGVDAAVDDPCAALAGHAPDLVAAQGVAGVDADADDVAGMNGLGYDLFEGLIDEDGVAGDGGCSCCKDKQPARRDDGRAKRIITGIDQVNAHRILPSLVRVRWLQRVSSQWRVCAWNANGENIDRGSSRRAVLPSYIGGMTKQSQRVEAVNLH